MNDTDSWAVAIIIVFGALIVGGLMAAGIAFGERDGFLFALGAATAAWLGGYALLIDRARIFATLIAVATAMAIAATLVLFY